MSGDDLLAYQDIVREIPVAEPIVRYAVRLARASRPESEGAPSVVRVVDRITGQPQTQDEVAKQIKGVLTAEKRQKAFDAYAAKLKAGSTVKVMVTQAELRALVGTKKATS